MKSFIYASILLSFFAMTACSGSFSVGEVEIGGETVLEDYEVSFGEDEE